MSSMCAFGAGTPQSGGCVYEPLCRHLCVVRSGRPTPSWYMPASDTLATRSPQLPARREGRPYAVGYAPVLLVEQNELGKQALEGALLKEGLQMLWARSGAEAEELSAARQPGLILLNPRLTPDDGWVVYRRLLRFATPIMILAGAGPAVCRIALSLGAVECLTTATPPEEIAASVRRLLGHAGSRMQAPKAYGGICLDVAAGRARLGQREVALTRSECALLNALIEANGHVTSREQLVQRVRATAGALPLARSIEAHARSLRRKLGDDIREPKLIEAVRGFGYRIRPLAPAAIDGLGEAAFVGLPVTALVIDRQRRIQFMNRQAEVALGLTASDAHGRACGELLGCGAKASSDGACPAWAGMDTTEPQHISHRVRLNHESVLVRETVVSLPQAAGHMVLALEQVDDD